MIAAPGGVNHVCKSTVNLGSYTIPKGTVIQACFGAILGDSDTWKNGAVFDPTRFLNEEGQLFKNQSFIPFSTGKRICPGDTLAKAELFLFTVGLLKNFKFDAVDPTNPPDPKIIVGGTRMPEPFNIRLTKIN